MGIPPLRLIAAALGLALLPAAQSAGPALQGTWQGEQSFGRGANARTLVSTYVFKVEGDQFTGLVVNTRNRSEIVDGTLAGDHLAFGTRNPFLPRARPYASPPCWPATASPSPPCPAPTPPAAAADAA